MTNQLARVASLKSWLGWLAFAALIIANVLLVRQNMEMARRMDVRDGKTIAERVPFLRGVGLDERSALIEFPSDRLTLLFTFSPNCRYCQASMPEWRVLSRQANSLGWQIVWVSRDSVETTKPYATLENILEPVLSDVPYGTYAELGLAEVPRTTILSRDGTVILSVLGTVDSVARGTLSRTIDQITPRSSAASIGHPTTSSGK